MAYYSKYTGKELEERLDRINDIPALIDKLFLNKEYLTELEVKCLIKEMIPLFYKDIPIDNKTIYWDNGVLKSVCTGEGNNEEEEEDYQCLWELREHNGQQYIYSKLPVVTQYGITIYGNNDDIDLPSLYAGLPIDNQTIYWDNGVLKSLGGGGGLDEEALRNYLLINEYVTRDELPSLNGYATESWVLNLGYIGPEGLKNYVDISSNQDINGKKNFKSGISINGLDIYQSQDDVIYLDANLVVRGGITMYSVNEADIPSIIDYIPTASTTTKGIASFDDSFFTVDSNGKVSLINSSSGGGIDETELEAYLTSNNYAKKTDIPSLVGYATESWVNTRIDSLINGAPAAYDTLKEIADVLQGNVNSIGDIITALGTKWTQDNTKIANWDTAYSWGNHANAGYALKSYVDSTFVTLGSKQTITGEKNFTGGIKVNGSPIYYDSTKKYWKLEGDLLVTGGITMYGDSVSGGGSVGATTLGQLQNVGNWADSVADVDRIMYQAAGSSNWIAKSLSSIGGVSGDYLPLSGGELTGSLAVTAKSNGYWSGGIRIDGTTDMPPSLAFHIPSKIGSRIYVDVNSPYDIIHELSTFSPVEKRIILHSSNYSQYALPISGGELSGDLSLSNDKYLLGTHTNGSTKYRLIGLNDVNLLSIGTGTAVEGIDTYISGNNIWFRYSNSPTRGMVLTSFGNVGIGTTDPKTSLHVSGSNTVTLVANSTSSDETAMAFHLSNVAKAYVGWSKTYGAYLYNSPKGYYLSIKDDGSLFYNGGTIWHSGNFTPSNYLPLTGGTLSGALTFANNTWNPVGDDIAIGDFNSAGMFGIKSLNSERTGLWFYGSSGEDHGALYTTGTSLLWRDYTIWHSGNDGSGSGLDADLLDGLEGGAFLHYAGFWNNANSASGRAALSTTYWADGQTGYLSTYGTSLNFHGGEGMWHNSFACRTDGHIDFYQGINTTTMTHIGTLAYTWSNVASANYATTAGSATKLQTARTIWGQSFDGTGNVDGDINSSNKTFNVFANSREILSYSTEFNYLSLGYGTLKDSFTTYLHGYHINLRYGANGTDGLVLKSSGNVGIGTTNPNQKLHVQGTGYFNEFVTVNGNINCTALEISSYIPYIDFHYNQSSADYTARIVQYSSSQLTLEAALVQTSSNFLASGGITMYSDQRKKTILNHVELSLKQIANAPLIEHYYNSDDAKTTHVGSIAQYWASMNDWFCKLDSEGFYTMEIQNCALASAISIARELDRYESKTDKTIKQLKKRICQLEEEVERLKRA